MGESFASPQSSERELPAAQESTDKQTETLEVKGTRTGLALSNLSYEDKILFSGDSLAKLFEGKPQFWLERTGSSEMQTRLYVDGLGPERIRWFLNGHAMGDLAVVGWQISDIPVEWVGKLSSRSSGRGVRGFSSFRPSLGIETRPLDDELSLGGRLGLGTPHEAQAGLEIATPELGRLNLAYTSRFGGRTIYDDQGTWYDPIDDRLAQFEMERSGRESVALEKQWSLGTSGPMLQFLGFYMRDFRRGPASVQSDSVEVQSERDGIFGGLRLAEESDDGDWALGLNGFSGTRESRRTDKAGFPLSALADRYRRASGWFEREWIFGNERFRIDGSGTLTSRRESAWRNFGEVTFGGVWRHRWLEEFDTDCALEGLSAQRPDGTWLVRPMGYCGLELRGAAFTLTGTVEYSLRRPTWVEWFGDGADLLSNETLKPEWGAGSGLELEWFLGPDWTLLVDARLRLGRNWIAWIPSSFATRKAENLGEFRQGVLGVSTRWSPNSSFQGLVSVRGSWARERGGDGAWSQIPQDAPIRILAQLNWSPVQDTTLNLSGDYLGQRPLDRQNLIVAEDRMMLHAGFIWQLGSAVVISIRGRNLLNRLSSSALSPSGESLDIAEMSVLGFPVNGREIMLTLSLKALEDM